MKSNFLVGEIKPDLQNLLNIIIPPREWVIENKTYIQYVSHSSASREDVINLQKLLDERLLVRQVRGATGWGVNKLFIEPFFSHFVVFWVDHF